MNLIIGKLYRLRNTGNIIDDFVYHMKLAKTQITYNFLKTPMLFLRQDSKTADLVFLIGEKEININDSLEEYMIEIV